MTLKTCLGAAAAALLLACQTSPALAGPPKSVFPEAAHSVEGGRAVQVLVPQTELKSNINQSNIVVATGGGLLGALIDAELNRQRTVKAEAAIIPLRATLTGFDTDALAVDATQKIVQQVSWLQPQPPAFGRDTSPPAKMAALDGSGAPQTVFFEYVYDTAPDFSSVRVSLNMQVAQKVMATAKKPEARLQPRNLVYAQTLTSVVSLAAPSKDLDENVAQWQADNGAATRKALAMAFEQLTVMAPRALALTEADLKAMNGRDKKWLGLSGYGGRIQEQGPDGTLLFSGGLVHVRTLTP